MSIRHYTSCFGAAAALACLFGPVPARAQSGPPTGRLSCTVGASFGTAVKTQKPLECRFRPRRGPMQYYTGIVRQFGLDLGSIRATTMSWHVYGPYARAPLGALNGRYAAQTAAAAPGSGASSSPLIGGEDDKVSLQPRAIQTTRGFNVAGGVTQFELTLAAAGPGRRR